MKKALSIIMVMAMVLSMIPVVFAENAEPVVITSGTDVAASVAEPVTYTWTAPANGTLTVTMGAASPGWRYTIFDGAGNTVGLPKSGKTEKSADFTLVAGTAYKFVATGFNSSAWEECSANITYTLSFAAESSGSGEIVKSEYEISKTAITLGSNSLKLLDTAITTIFVFEPSETAVYTFTAPEGAILGYWGAGSWFLSDPKSTSNTYEWTCTGVGQTAYIGISGIEGDFTLQIEKTGEYIVIEPKIIPYENKATLEPFALPEGAQLHGYIDVKAETTHTAVLGDDGYYHFGSADGDVILVDMDYQDIILSAALLSDRPVMYVHETDENGYPVKYDIGESIKAYEAVTDGNGYYPLTEDLMYFYDNYANGAGVYTYYIQDSYNPDNVWMYCMRTATFPEITEPDETDPTEPEVTEPEVTEPEVTEPEVTEPEVTEPEVTEPEVTEPTITEPSEPSEPAQTEPTDGIIVLQETVTGSSSTKYVYTYTPEEDGTISITVGDGSTNWSSDVIYFVGVSITTVETASGTNAGTYQANVTAGTKYRIRVWTTSGDPTPLTVVFQSGSETPTDPTPEPTEPETPKKTYEISGTALNLGDNTLATLDTANTTVYMFMPTEVGTYIFTGPEGNIVGNWGSNAYYLTDPNSTTNSCEWTCSSVGQSVYIGVSGINGDFTMTIALKEVEEPDVTEPEITEPEVTEPQITEPEATEPTVTEPAPTLPADAIYVDDAGTLVGLMKTNMHGTIVLNNDIDLGSSVLTIFEGCSFVLDLNGYTLSNNKSSGACVDVKGSLVIQDISAEGDGKIINQATSSSRGVIVSGANASLTIKGGSVDATTQPIRVEAGSILMEGGALNGSNYGIYVGSGASANITGGYITCGTGSFNNVVYAGGTSAVTISGGWFNGGAPSGNGLIGGISGGCFARKFTNDAYFAKDCYWEDRLDSVYLFEVINPNAVPEEPEPSEPEATELVHQWNLVLDDDLKVNFHLNIDAAIVSTAQIEITIGEDNFLFNASELAVTEDGKYIASINAAAAQMMDEITVKIVGAEESEKTYTIRQYADVVLADSKLSQYHALIKEMLNYGAAAQLYFEYNKDNPANTGITGTAAAEIPEAAAEEHKVNTDIDGIIYYGSSLVYKDKIAVRFYFDAEAPITGYTFTVNGVSYKPVASGDLYFVEIANICPQNLDQQITITVSDGADGTLTVSYGPMNYIVRMNKNYDSDSLKNLLKALYNYHLAAKNLRAN